MIARLSGRVVEKLNNTLIIDVGGVGYEVFVSTHDSDTITTNTNVTLYTFFSVRENAQELYGFTSLGAKALFEQLKSVSGVGPKVALSIVSIGEPSAVQNAIASGDTAYISSAVGVGKRVAEKVVVELRDKVHANGAPSTMGLPGTARRDDDAQEALLALGYSSGQAAQALNGIDRSLGVEERIKLALKELA